jgi:hypothetical protein
MEWVVVLFLLVGVAMLIFHYQRSGSILHKWAAANGYRILSSERRHLRRGPFFFTTARGQEVYRVMVEDSAGTIRRGYVRCGSYFLGMFSDKAETRWDKEPTYQPGFPVVMPERQDPPE